MLEVTDQKINTNVKYNSDEKEEIVGKITDDFKKFDDDRQNQIRMIEKVANLLEMNYQTLNYSDEKSFNESVKKLILKDANIREICNSAIAHTYNSTFKTPSQMFNVELEMADSEIKNNIQFIQKAAILEVLKKSKAKPEFRKAVENWYKKGEFILYISWKREYQTVRRQVGFEFKPLGINLKRWEVSKQTKYDGAKIKAVEPEMFVWDTSRDFEDACKIYKTWVTYNEVKTNERYKEFLSTEELKELKDCSGIGDKDNSNVELDKQQKEGYKNGQIECLEFYGDLEINKNNDTVFYPNMHIIILARKYVACFEYNPNIIDPFVCIPYEIDPNTGRGLSFLTNLFSLSEATTETLNKIRKAVGLSIYKCHLAPRGAFKGSVDVEENKVIEYDPSLMPVPPTPLDFSSGLRFGVEFLKILEDKKEQATGRFKYSTGDTGKPRTAREATITQIGQDALVSFEQDKIAEGVLTAIEKIGELMANFQDQPISIKYRDEMGIEQNGIIDATVRTARYVYTVGDTQTAMEKKAKGLEAMQALPQMRQLLVAQGKDLNSNEVFNMWGSINDIENPSKFIIERQLPQIGGLNAIAGRATAGNPSIPTMPNTGVSGMENPLLSENLQLNQ